MVHSIDSYSDKIELVALALTVERPEAPNGERIALWTELGRWSELRPEHGRVLGIDCVPVASVGMVLVEVQPREVVSEGHVVDTPLFEQQPCKPMEGRMLPAGQYCVVGQEPTGFRNSIGNELVVRVEARSIVATNTGQES